MSSPHAFQTCNTEGRPRAWLTPFATFAEAEAVCGNGCDTEGYSQASVAGCEAMRAKLAVSDSEIGSVSLGNMRILSALCGLQSRLVRVLDLGGGAGLHYFVARAATDDRIQFRWHVVETPSLAAAAAGMTNSELAFFDNLEKAVAALDGIDLVFLSGVLQCLPEPIKALERLSLLRPSVLCISRTAMSPTRKRHVLIQQQGTPSVADGTGGPEQNGYPVILEPRASFEAVLRPRFGRIIRIVEDQRVYDIQGHSAHMFGYLCRNPS